MRCESGGSLSREAVSGAKASYVVEWEGRQLASGDHRMLAVHLDPQDEQRLAKLAAARGETVEATVRRFVIDRLHEEGWSELSDDEWAMSCEAMTAEVLPDEDWSDSSEGTSTDGSR